MASTKEQILAIKRDIDAKTGQLQRAQTIDATMSPEEIRAAQNTAERIQSSIDRLNLKLSELELPARKRKAEAEKAKAKASGEVTATNLPDYWDTKLTADFKAAGISITDEIFMQGGVANSMLVYKGEKDKYGAYQTGATTKTFKAPDISLTNDVTQSYWNDKSVQDKVLSAMRAAGKTNVNILDGFAQWQGVVQTAANVFQGGKGPKMTPMDILNMTIKNSGGPQVSKDIQQYDKNILSSLVEGVYMKTAMRKPTAEELAERLAEMDKVIQAGVTTTTKGTTTTRTPSVSLTGLEEAVTKKVKKTAPEGVATAKGIQFHDWMAQQMREGI
jgi:hypothetical protein